VELLLLAANTPWNFTQTVLRPKLLEVLVSSKMHDVARENTAVLAAYSPILVNG
jgi:hypothetical protein